MVVNGPQSIPHLHTSGAVGKGGPCDTGGFVRNNITRLGGQGHTTFLTLHQTHHSKTRCMLPADGRRPPYLPSRRDKWPRGTMTAYRLGLSLGILPAILKPRHRS